MGRRRSFFFSIPSHHSYRLTAQVIILDYFLCHHPRRGVSVSRTWYTIIVMTKIPFINKKTTAVRVGLLSSEPSDRGATAAHRWFYVEGGGGPAGSGEHLLHRRRLPGEGWGGIIIIIIPYMTVLLHVRVEWGRGEIKKEETPPHRADHHAPTEQRPAQVDTHGKPVVAAVREPAPRA